jgi:hypothetical protein
MYRNILFLILLFSATFVSGQRGRALHIHADNVATLKLSEIAEDVVPVPLNRRVSIQNVFLTEGYIFVTSNLSVLQFDASGKYIRTINCGGHVTNVTGDEAGSSIYILVGNEIKSYDFSGKQRRTYPLKHRSLSGFYHDGKIYVQSYDEGNDRVFHYKLSVLDPVSGREMFLPFEMKENPFVLPSGGSVNVSSLSLFSLYERMPVSSFATDSVMYQIREGKPVPLVRWQIEPGAQSFGDKGHICQKGFAGKYLFVHYCRAEQYLYVEDTKSGKSYNLRCNDDRQEGIEDDWFNTGKCHVRILQGEGRFYFLKSSADVKENYAWNTSKDATVLFIVKTKS